MFTRKRRLLSLSITSLLLMMIMLTFATNTGTRAAHAQSLSGTPDTVSGAVTPGTLSMTNGGATVTSGSFTLDGTNHTLTYQIPVTVNDETGSGAGWNLSITSTQFTTGGGTPHTLATNVASIAPGLATPTGAGTYTNPTNSVGSSIVVPAAATAPAASEIYNAAANTGMGDFTFLTTVTVSVPANTYAGTYSSTITLSVNSGP